ATPSTRSTPSIASGSWPSRATPTTSSTTTTCCAATIRPDHSTGDQRLHLGDRQTRLRPSALERGRQAVEFQRGSVLLEAHVVDQAHAHRETIGMADRSPAIRVGAALVLGGLEPAREHLRAVTWIDLQVARLGDGRDPPARAGQWVGAGPVSPVPGVEVDDGSRGWRERRLERRRRQRAERSPGQVPRTRPGLLRREVPSPLAAVGEVLAFHERHDVVGAGSWLPGLVLPHLLRKHGGEVPPAGDVALAPLRGAVVNVVVHAEVALRLAGAGVAVVFAAVVTAGVFAPLHPFDAVFGFDLLEPASFVGVRSG